MKRFVMKDEYWGKLVSEWHRSGATYFHQWMYDYWSIKIIDEWQGEEIYSQERDRQKRLEFQDDKKATEFFLRYGH